MGSRPPIERLLDDIDWKPLPEPTEIDGLPYATHEGVLHIADIELRVYQLNTGERVIDEESLVRLCGGGEDSNG